METVVGLIVMFRSLRSGFEAESWTEWKLEMWFTSCPCYR